MLIFTGVQFIFEDLIIFICCCLVLCLAYLWNLQVELPLELILKDFDIFHFINILLHDVLDIHQVLLIVLDTYT